MEWQGIPKLLQEDPKMFWSYNNKFKWNLRDKLDISEIIDILTSGDMENMPLMSQISFVQILWVVYFPVKHLCLYNKVA